MIPPQAAAPHDWTHNVAEAGATVGVQGRVIHNVNVYQQSADATPRQQYELGLRYLNDGVPFQAEKLIGKAIAGGLDDAEVRLHWVLAVFSKRSYRDLDHDERTRLDELASRLRAYPEGEHRKALEAVSELVGHFSGSGGSVEAAEKQLLELGPELLASVQRHLQNVLSGATQDTLWTRARQRADAGRTAGDRSGRVWAYFHPEPIPARVGGVEPRADTLADGPLGVIGAFLAAVAAGYLGWMLWGAGAVLALIALPLAVAAGVYGFREGAEWRYRNARIKLEDHRNDASPAVQPMRGDGFAKQVGHSFEYYFAKYCPQGVDPGVWLSATAGVRGRFREEIAAAYREQRVPIGRVRWLIGHIAKDVRTRWTDGTMFDYRVRLRTRAVVKLKCLTATALLLVAAAVVFDAAAAASTLAGPAVTVAAVVTGLYALRKWERIRAAGRRYEDDEADTLRRLHEREAAYDRWKAYLDSVRPNETEMEDWLLCDKTVMIDDALRHYRLSWRDVIAHAVLHGHVGRAKAGRARGGPWRYSKYDLRLFLITRDGVREVSSVLDFEQAEFAGQERSNYRFDAMSSVTVADSARAGHTMTLTLTNGPARDINVTDTSSMESHYEAVHSDVHDDPEHFLEMNLSAAGFEHALRILEGIAAEGKGWIGRAFRASDH